MIQIGCMRRRTQVDRRRLTIPEEGMSALVWGSDSSCCMTGTITWVPDGVGVPSEIRVYNHLFTVEEPDDGWEEQLNPNSLELKPDGKG